MTYPARAPRAGRCFLIRVSTWSACRTPWMSSKRRPGRDSALSPGRLIPRDVPIHPDVRRKSEDPLAEYVPLDLCGAALDCEAAGAEEEPRDVAADEQALAGPETPRRVPVGEERPRGTEQLHAERIDVLGELCEGELRHRTFGAGLARRSLLLGPHIEQPVHLASGPERHQTVSLDRIVGADPLPTGQPL